MRKLFICFVLFCAISCSRNSQISEVDLIGCWNHDIESQDLDSDVTYLLLDCDAKDFPPQHFRYSLILEEDGVGSEYQLAENDAHFFKSVTWSLESNILIIDSGLNVSSYLIDDVEDDSFRMTRQ